MKAKPRTTSAGRRAAKSAPGPVELKSIATLIDELCTVSQKCWHQQEAVLDAKLKPAQRHAAAVAAHEANKRRCDLMRAIDRRFDGAASGVLAKTF